MTEQVCAIVGVGDGMGLALARRFGQEGFKIALLARNADKLQNYVATLAEENITAHSFPTDASNPEALIATLDQVKQELGNPEVLIYNVFQTRKMTPTELTPEILLADFQVNVVGALVAVQQVIPAMQAERSGTIIITGGGLAINPRPLYASLALDKAALRNLTFNLAQELQPNGIYVAIVTIAGFIQPNTHFDPDKIAEVYWQMHSERQLAEFAYQNS